MSKIKGIYSASMSVLNDDLTLNIDQTINHAESLIENGCHGTIIFGSTGQAQLISISEKIKLFNQLSTSKYKEKFIIGTGLNSLSETINLISVAKTLNFKKFLIMPPAFYKYSDSNVINFYSKIIEAHPECEIILYNFEKLCGYKFSVECVQRLAKLFPEHDIPEPQFIQSYFWKGGIHFFKPGFNYKMIGKNILKPFSNQNLFIVGECYSSKQGWIEGALISVEQMLRLY